MEADVLTLLPPRGLDQSILLAVLMGLLVLLFLTECFGWVFAGLVVPGYLASIFVMSVGAGIAVLFEGVVTFLIARALTTFVSKSEAGTQFFGRERFFVIVLVSVVVRQNSEIWLLPTIAPYIDQVFGTTFAAQRQLASIGLVLVPLTANMFWKHTLTRGLMQVGVPVAITYALLYFLVLPYTNLSYSSLELTYENTALDFLASPKAYIILLVGAYLASRFNLTYGWDYNGILVPALLSLTWMEPMRILTTVIEALILLYAAELFMKLPHIRTFNFEGPRKVVVVFVIGFLLKYSFSWGIGDYAPTQRITDLFGFGYLLPSLLATKMLQKKTVGRVLLPALETSLLAFIIANLLGIALDVLAPPKPPPLAEHQANAYPTSVLVRSTLGATMTARTRARLDNARLEPLEQPRAKLRYYEELWRDLDAALPESDADWLRSRFSVRANTLGLELRKATSDSGRDALILMESEESLDKQAGWDTSVLFPGSSGPVITVPRPDGDPDAAEGGLWICERIACRALIVSGFDSSRIDNVPEGDALKNPRTSFNFAHRALELTPIVQLRVFDDESADVANNKATLHIKGRLTSDLDLGKLWPDPVVVAWEPPKGDNVQWQERENLAVLRISPAAMDSKLVAASAPLCAWRHPSLSDFLAEHFDSLQVPDTIHAPISTPCGWLAVTGDTNPCTGGARGTGSAALAPAEQRKPLTSWLVGHGRDIPDTLARALIPFAQRAQHESGARVRTRSMATCSAGSELSELIEVMRPSRESRASAPLSESELEFMRKHLLIPLLGAIMESTTDSDVNTRLRRLRQRARLVGYELGVLQECDGTGTSCWILAQHKSHPGQSSVLTIIRSGRAAPVAIEVPKPDIEPGTWRLGFELWRRTQARVLILGIAVQEQRLLSEERELRKKRDKLFHALHQSVDTALSNAGPERGLILQVRGYGSWRQLDDALVIATGLPLLRWNEPTGDAGASDGRPDAPGTLSEASGQNERDMVSWEMLELPPVLAGMLSEEQNGVLLEFGDVRAADGAEEIIELRGHRNPQLSYTRRIGKTDMAVLWFSQNTRLKYKSYGSILECRALSRTGLLASDDLAHPIEGYLTTPALSAPPAQPSSRLASRALALRDTVERAAAFENVHLLRKLAAERDTATYVRAFSDAQLGRPYLTLEVRAGREVYRMAALFGDAISDPALIEAGRADTDERIRQAVLRRASPIIIHGTDDGVVP